MDELSTDVQSTEVDQVQPAIATTPTETPQAAPKSVEDLKTLADGGELTEKPAKAPVDAQTPAAPAVQEFQPNFKYKVYGQEKELDPRLQGLVKSKEDQEWITKVMSKADGIDGVLQQRDLYRQNYQNIEKQATSVLSAVDKDDYAGMFKALGKETPSLEKVVKGLGISDEDLIRFAYQRATLTDEQRQHYDIKQQLEAQNRDHQAQAQAYQAELQQIQVTTRENELSSALSNPEIAPIVQAFDQNHGQGAFWEEVRLRGIAHFNLNKVDAPVSQMVRDVASRLAPYGRANQAPTQMMPTQMSTPAPQAVSQARSPQVVPTIPVVPSGGTSPAKKAMRSIADIESAYNDLD